MATPAAPGPSPTAPPPPPAAAANVATQVPPPSPKPGNAPTAPHTAPPQLASQTPAAASSSAPERTLSIDFAAGTSDLSDSAKGTLDKIVSNLQRNADERLQLAAYAAGSDDQASQARRLSLTRALAVRTYLIDKGIASTRIDVRALGNKVEGGGPADRVDLVFLNK
ncbi:MAG TPA: OmpA family protein [Alphaproteobacteria bacterium]|nr:OmpA family protein [Alphaproteobacteria bacterium]